MSQVEGVQGEVRGRVEVVSVGALEKVRRIATVADDTRGGCTFFAGVLNVHLIGGAIGRSSVRACRLFFTSSHKDTNASVAFFSFPKVPGTIEKAGRVFGANLHIPSSRTLIC